MSGLFLLLSCLVEISELNENNVDPDQTTRSDDQRGDIIWLVFRMYINRLLLQFCLEFSELTYNLTCGFHCAPAQTTNGQNH